MNALRRLVRVASVPVLGTLIVFGAAAEKPAPPSEIEKLARATFAGGCFW